MNEKSHASSPFKKVISRLLAAILVAVVLVVFYQQLFRAPLNSDRANFILASMAFSAGNWRLQGWALPPDNFWGLEIPLTALIWAVTGSSQAVSRLVPAIAWMTLVGATAWIATFRLAGWRSLTVIVAFMSVPFPAANIYPFYEEAPIHVLTVTCIALSIGLANQFATGTSKYWILLVYSPIAIDASASDPLFVLLGAAPLLGGLVLFWRQKRERCSVLFAVTVSSIALGRSLVGLNSWDHGFSTAVTDFHLISLDRLLNSLHILCHALLEVASADAVDLSSGHAVLAFLHWPMFAAVVVSIGGCCLILALLLRAQWERPSAATLAPNFLESVLALIVLCNCLAMLLSAQVENVACVRYFLPAWMALTALMARWASSIRIMPFYCGLVGAFVVVADVVDIYNMPHAGTTNEIRAVVQLLEASGLREGYGTYWLSSVITVESDSSVTVRAVIADSAGKLSPFIWLCDKNWYRKFAEERPFFVIRTGENDYYVPPNSTLQTFGVPTKVLRTGNVIIEVYGRR